MTQDKKRMQDTFGMSPFTSAMDDFINNPWNSMRNFVGDTFKMDVRDEGKQYVIEADLPGVDKKDVTIDYDEGRLKIAVSQQSETEDKQDNFIRRERHFAGMQRTVFLNDATGEGIKAKLENGVLTLNVPKEEKTDTSRRIDVD